MNKETFIVALVGLLILALVWTIVDLDKEVAYLKARVELKDQQYFECDRQLVSTQQQLASIQRDNRNVAACYGALKQNEELRKQLHERIRELEGR